MPENTDLEASESESGSPMQESKRSIAEALSQGGGHAHVEPKSSADVSGQLAGFRESEEKKRVFLPYSGLAAGLLAQLGDVAEALWPGYMADVRDERPEVSDEELLMSLFLELSKNAGVAQERLLVSYGFGPGGATDGQIAYALGSLVMTAFTCAYLLDLNLGSAIELACNDAAVGQAANAAERRGETPEEAE